MSGLTLHTGIAVAAAVVFILFLLFETRRSGAPPRHWWGWSALLALLFLGFSLTAVFLEGPLGFWPEHVRHYWGNQIWIDLLLAAGTAWCLLLPRLRGAGMNPWPWLAMVVTTGSVGILATYARLRYLECASVASPQ